MTDIFGIVGVVLLALLGIVFFGWMWIGMIAVLSGPLIECFGLNKLLRYCVRGLVGIAVSALLAWGVFSAPPEPLSAQEVATLDGLCAAFAAEAQQPVSASAIDKPWLRDPIVPKAVVAIKRINVGVHMFLGPDRFVVSKRVNFADEPGLWLLTVSDPSTCPKFGPGNGLVVEATVYQDGSVRYAIVGWVGRAWEIPLQSFDPWKPQRI
jgi:hypothetical protein